MFMLAGVLLVFFGLILFRPLRINWAWSIDVKDWLHWTGIAAASLLSITTILALRLFRHRVTPLWLNIHCVSSFVSAGLALVHSRTKAAVILPVHYHSYLTLGLLLFLTVSGALIRFYPDSLYVKKYWKLYHLPFSIGFYVTLLYHVVLKLGVI